MPRSQKNKRRVAAGSVAGRLMPYFAIVLWAGFIYFRAVPHSFVYDDQPQIVRNTAIQSLPSVLDYFRHGVDFNNEFTGQSGKFYRPMFYLSLWADYAVWGPATPAGFHSTNVILHALNGVLVLLLAGEVFNGTVGLLAALTWLSLPIQSEVVAWVSGRGLSLATAFILLTLIQALRFAKDGKAIRLWCMGLTCSGALLSHEAGIVAPALAILVAASVSVPSRRRTVMAVVPAVVIPAGVYLFARAFLLHLGVPAASSIHDILLRTPVSVAKYFWWTIHAPAMSVERSTELAGIQFTSPVYVLAWVTLAATGLIAICSSARLIALSVAATLITLLPFSQILPLYQSTAERYAYTASIGILFAIVALLKVMQQRLHLPQWAPHAVMSAWIALSILPLQERITAWSDEQILYKTSLRSSPQSFVLYHNLAVAEEDAGRFDAAIEHYEKSIDLKPDYITARRDLANLCLRNKRFSEADRAYTELLRYSPENRDAQLNLAHVRLAQGKRDSAIVLLRTLVTRYPEFFEAQVDLGVALFAQKDPEARTHLETALRLQPASAEAAYNLGVLEEDAGHPDEALKLYRRALLYRPGNQSAAERVRDLTANKSLAFR